MMLIFRKLTSLLEFLNKTCIKRLKHSSVKKVTPKEKNKYTNTINLPKTNFPLWLNGYKRTEVDEQIIKNHSFTCLYNWQRDNMTGTEYVLHDGPPYANGLPHMGHAINKILKDITARHKLLQGQRIHYKPGWDCHGLPIELKAMAGQDIASLSPLAIRKQARKFAEEAIRDQKAVFKSWGVMADWENGCYFTFDKSYIKNEIRQFYKLFEKGFIYRDFKPVYWSPSSRTALAEAELEYNDSHESIATYVRVLVTGMPEALGKVYALLWTTTPWTLPANQAVAYNPALPYSLVSLHGQEDKYIVATALVDHLAQAIGKQISIVDNVNASLFSTLRYEHPLNKCQSLPFLAADYVTADKGTGLVHTAPAHGPDDFKLAQKYNLQTVSLVDEGGLYNEEAGPVLSGQAVLTHGTNTVIELCKENGALVHTSKFKHAYPYDWRTGLPIILRASPQWFFDTSTVKEQALEALKDVNIIPDRGSAGLVSQLQTRPFWCISRQRCWGVPIPVLYTSSGHPVLSQDLIDHYCQLLDSEGSDFWWSCSSTTLAPPHLLEKLNLSPDSVERGQDILDIWLDSGLSWSAVLNSPKADLYLEGVDQFNGWFQSSLLTSVALQKVPPYKTVFVHGFAVDEDGMKMSKSLGNVINPQNIIYGGVDTRKEPVYGVDTLRWWVAAHATQHSSVPVSSTTLTDSKASVQRLRSVFKFLLGGLHSLPLHLEPPPLRLLDLYMLHCLYDLDLQVKESYNKFQYNKVCSTILNFVSNQVSAMYCHLTKDRLYCESENSKKRRAVQLVLYHTLVTLTRLAAPIVPILAEEIYSYQPVKVSESIFHDVSSSPKVEWHDTRTAAIVELALQIKKQVASLVPLNCDHWEMYASISAPSEQYSQLQAFENDERDMNSELCEILQVSSVKLSCEDSSASTTGIQVKLGLMEMHHCERCRKYTAPASDMLCSRCEQVLASN